MRIDLLAGARPTALLAIAAGLAACSAASPAAHPSVPPASVSRAPVSPAPHSAASHAPATPATHPASTDVHACFDGDCRVTVTAPVTIPVASRFGFSSVRVTVAGSLVTVTAHPPGGTLDDTVLVPGRAALNDLTIDLQAVTGSKVTLTFEHD